MSDKAQPIEQLAQALAQFAREREWEPFHSPKNLACALSVEASELLEHFQWLTDEQSRQLDATKREAVALEMADVLLYLVRMASVTGIDLLDAARRKMAINARKYPVERAKGSSKKYDQL
jgi:dCTP diphosphatase